MQIQREGGREDTRRGQKILRRFWPWKKFNPPLHGGDFFKQFQKYVLTPSLLSPPVRQQPLADAQISRR